MKKIALISLFLLMLFLISCNSNEINYEIEKNDLYGKMLLKLNEEYVDSVINNLNYSEMKNIVKLHQYYIYGENQKYHTFSRDFTSASLKQFDLVDCNDAQVKVKIKATGSTVALAQHIYPRSSCLFHKKISSIFLRKENCLFETGSNLSEDQSFYSKRLMYLCQTQKAVYNKDLNFCNRLNSEGKENTQQECYFELGQIYSDDSVCEMIDDKLDNSKVQCYGFLGANLKDESFCENLEKAREKGDCRSIVSGLAS